MLTDHVSEWARPYGMPARTVDGNDVEAVESAAREAVQYVRTNRKPYFLETYTYRLRGHMEPDDQKYVDRAELVIDSPKGTYRGRDLIDARITLHRDNGAEYELRIHDVTTTFHWYSPDEVTLYDLRFRKTARGRRSCSVRTPAPG